MSRQFAIIDECCIDRVNNIYSIIKVMKATPRIKHSCKSSPTLRGRNHNQAVPVQDQCFLPTDADIVSFINVDYQGKELGNGTLTFEPQHVISNNVAF